MPLNNSRICLLLLDFSFNGLSPLSLNHSNCKTMLVSHLFILELLINLLSDAILLGFN